MKYPFMAWLGFVATLAISCKRATPEEEFWKWFQNNEQTLFDFEKDQERIFDHLNEQMHKVNPNLTFEFGPKRDGCREFVISADGIKSAFPAVESLYAVAPLMPRWEITKFRPRRPPLDLQYKNISVKAESVKVQIKRNGQVADVRVLIPGYSEADKKDYMGIAFLLLDGALGEYDVEMRIGQISVEASSETTGQTYSLAEMPRAFDALFVN